jgi:hypothetical protein
LYINKEDGCVLDKEFLAKMLKFHKKVNPKEGLVGLYFSSNLISIHVMEIFMYFIELFKDKKNRAHLPAPLLMLVDPTMQDNRMSIKVSTLHILCALVSLMKYIAELILIDTPKYKFINVDNGALQSPNKTSRMTVFLFTLV